MVGIQGQTKEMIRNDIRLLKQFFKLGTINVFTNNSTDVKRDGHFYLEELPHPVPQSWYSSFIIWD